MLSEVKSAKITSRGQIAIPKEIRASTGFKEGSKVVVLAFEDHIELRPIEQINQKMIFKENMLAALASEKTLAKDWLSKEDEEAWKGL